MVVEAVASFAPSSGEPRRHNCGSCRKVPWKITRLGSNDKDRTRVGEGVIVKLYNCSVGFEDEVILKTTRCTNLTRRRARSLDCATSRPSATDSRVTC